MAALVACSHPHVFAHTLRFSARGFLALTKNAWFLEVPFSNQPQMTTANLGQAPATLRSPPFVISTFERNLPVPATPAKAFQP